MDENHRQDERGGQLRPGHRAAWALYDAKYLAAYQTGGIDFWGLSIRNESEATQTWDSCIYAGEDERDFVRDPLGPTLHREGWGHIKVIVWDHNRDRLYGRAFLNPDGQIAAVVLNRSDEATPFALKYHGQAAMTGAPAHSITTYRFSAVR